MFAIGWDPLTADDCNLYGQYALAYMRMLMSWPRAIFRLCAPLVLAQLVTAKVVIVFLSRIPRIVTQGPRESVMQPIIDETMNRLASWGPKARNAALKWIQNLAAPEESEPACRIHAEAGAVALASARLSHTRDWGLNGLEHALLVSVISRSLSP